MRPENYLADLTFRLFGAVAQLSADRREQFQKFFLRFQDELGGFFGRQGESNLYYTAFALRGLFLLGVLEDQSILNPISDFLESRQKEDLSAADLVSLFFSESLLRLVQDRELSTADRDWSLRQLERFRRPDGCYATSEKSAYSSTYQTFLAAAAFEILGAEKEKQSIPVEPILSRQREDGGFVELEKLHRSGTNPTAAAIGFLKMQGQMPSKKQKAVDFLLARQLPSGGFQANTKVPVADLLSSFTALVALDDLDARNQCHLNSLRKFVCSMQYPEGGYYGADWDRQPDIEYLFYGTALEAILQHQ